MATKCVLYALGTEFLCLGLTMSLIIQMAKEALKYKIQHCFMLQFMCNLATGHRRLFENSIIIYPRNSSSLWNPTARYPVHNSLPQDASPHYFLQLKIHLNVILRSLPSHCIQLLTKMSPKRNLRSVSGYLWTLSIDNMYIRWQMNGSVWSTGGMILIRKGRNTGRKLFPSATVSNTYLTNEAWDIISVFAEVVYYFMFISRASFRRLPS